MARGVKGTGRYSREKYKGEVHWFFWLLWVIALVGSFILGIGGK